ncbi:MAG: hypothetical protein ACOC5T_03870 [Elusimicrobiota bacterium]
MTDENKGGVVEGFSLSGEEVKELKDKNFSIYAEPFYREVGNLDNEKEKKRKLIVPVELANGTRAEWYANKTSQKIIMAKCGRNLKDWIGFKGKFKTRNQLVGKEDREVIYLEQ